MMVITIIICCLNDYQVSNCSNHFNIIASFISQTCETDMISAHFTDNGTEAERSGNDPRSHSKEGMEWNLNPGQLPAGLVFMNSGLY